MDHKMPACLLSESSGLADRTFFNCPFFFLRPLNKVLPLLTFAVGVFSRVFPHRNPASN
jgi:hypothetical protein